MSLLDYVKSSNIEKISLYCEMITKGELKKEDMLCSEMKDKYGRTVLHEACYGKLEIMKLLIITGNLQKEDIMMKDNYGKTALHIASSNGRLEIVKLLIEHGNLQKEDILPLHSSEMKYDYYKQTALIGPILYGHSEIVKLLIIKCNLQKNDILLLYSKIKENYNYYGYSMTSTQSLKQLFNEILFNIDINDMIKEIMVKL